MPDITPQHSFADKTDYLWQHGIRLNTLPLHMWASITDYILFGRPVGGFLMALLSNDLKETVARADDVNRDCLLTWVRFLVNDMPADSQGSPESVAEWMGRGGLIGRGREAA